MRWPLLTVLLICATPSAYAQTAGALPNNSRITAAQLNASLGAKMDANRIGVPNGVVGLDALGHISNQTLTGGQWLINPTYTTTALSSPAILCPGNSGPDYTSGGAYGVACFAIKPPSDSLGYEQTYGIQIALDVPALPKNTISFSARDQVALYPEVRSGAFGPAAWAENPLAQANKDASTTIISEMDLNNLSGCDSPGIDFNQTGGSASFIANRSDGSACPQKIGMLITGVAQQTSSAGLNFQYVSDGLHAMWQDGIRMLGGNMAAEYDWVSNTASLTAFKIYGAHGQHGVDMIDGNFAGGALALSAVDVQNGAIEWYVPKTGTVAGYPTYAGIAPENDGMIHLKGPDFTADSLFVAKGGISSTNYIVQSGGSFIFDLANGTAGANLTYDAPNLAVALNSASLEVSGSIKAPIANVQTVNSTTLVFDPTGSPPASSSAACTPGQAAWNTGFVYICVAANTWQRAALSNF